MQKVALFVDVQNIYYTTKEFHKCNFNYNAFWARATSNREVVKAIAGSACRVVEEGVRVRGHHVRSDRPRRVQRGVLGAGIALDP